MEIIKNPTRILFFTGKGGVGKTSLACATAVGLADQGKSVLLVSTDPASNLDEVLGTPLGIHPTVVPAVPRLSAMNLDPEKAAAEYRESIIGPYRSLLPASAVASMEEQFSGSCTLEIAAFDVFSRLIGDTAATAHFDHVIFDTAPTGHTLRLLTLPSAWSDFLAANTTGTSCLGPLAGLQSKRDLYQQTVNALCDGETTTLVLVSRPEATALREAARTSRELVALGVHNQRLIVNGVFSTRQSNDAVAVALQTRMQKALDAMPLELAALPRQTVPLSANGLLGIAALRAMMSGTAIPTESTIGPKFASNLRIGIGSLIDELVTAGQGVVMTMGKGGVGKTTIASSIAVALAERGKRVHLSTTDPAAHLDATITAEGLPNLTVDRIDPTVELAKYSTEVMQATGASLDPQGRALLAEDLRSPCTEEIAVFRAFANAVAEGRDRFVVLDTAPTGHTILLLDAALAYHREVTRQSSQLPDSVQRLLPRLRDPKYTRVIIVTLPEATPVHEAAQLQRDLRRAGIEPNTWVINQSLSPLTVTDPILRGRQNQEAKYIKEVCDEYSDKVALIPWQAEPPIGQTALSRLASQTTSSNLDPIR